MKKIIQNIQVDGETTYTVLDTDQTPAIVPWNDEVSLAVKLHGLDAGMTGDVALAFVFHNGLDWDTETDLSFTVTGNGTTDVVKSIPAVVLGKCKGIKLKTIDNTANANVAVTGESAGTGDGATLSFSGTTSRHPVKPSTVTFNYTIGGTAYTASDDGNGNITGTDVSGTITYQDGSWSLTFTVAPDSATAITVDYTVNMVVVLDYVAIGV